ncbi:hypothetical protein C8R46DRAFT_900364, partial [Mycena filopes]
PAVRKITYTASLLGLIENGKQVPALRTPIKTDLVYLNDDEPFDTLKAQLLVRIDAVYTPSKLDFDDYNISFTIPRLVKDAIVLDSASYPHLIKNTQKMDDPGARIRIDPKPDCFPATADKENEDETDKRAKGKKKSTVVGVPLASPDRILPGNAILNEKIGILRARWACPTPGGPCGSDFCFVKPNGEGHFPLSHEHVNVWAAAWLKGTNFANENKPPNDKLFDGVSLDALGNRSPLLQRRLELQNQHNAPAQPAMPQITINIPDMLQRFQPPAAPAPAPVPGAPHAFDSPPMLIPPPLVPGPKLSIEEFCVRYELDADIAARFREHRFKSTEVFRYIEVKELKELGFVSGEIAELKVAIATWAT